MFGYVVIDRQELTLREFTEYRSYYCGLCRELKTRHGILSQFFVNYDMTFLALFLTAMNESLTECGTCRCVAHPFAKHCCKKNEMLSYAADMSVILAYEKCVDDWMDEKKLFKRILALLFSKKVKKLSIRYPEKTAYIKEQMDRIHCLEKEKNPELDKIAGAFGQLVGELFVYKEDAWEESLRSFGFYLGKFIYLADAYEDVDRDIRKKQYNPLLQFCEETDFTKRVEEILTMMMTECAYVFEQLPILENVRILKNILYSGVWVRVGQITAQRQKRTERKEKHVESL